MEPEDALESARGELLPLLPLLPLRGVAVPDEELPDERVRPCSLYLTGGRNESIDEAAGVEDAGETQPGTDPDMPPPESIPEELEPLPTLPPAALPPPLGTAVPLPLSLRGTADPVVLPLDVRSWAAARPERGRLATVNATATVKSLWRVITPPTVQSGARLPRITQQPCQRAPPVFRPFYA